MQAPHVSAGIVELHALVFWMFVFQSHYVRVLVLVAMVVEMVAAMAVVQLVGEAVVVMLTAVTVACQK